MNTDTTTTRVLILDMDTFIFTVTSAVNQAVLKLIKMSFSNSNEHFTSALLNIKYIDQSEHVYR